MLVSPLIMCPLYIISFSRLYFPYLPHLHVPDQFPIICTLCGPAVFSAGFAVCDIPTFGALHPSMFV